MKLNLKMNLNEMNAVYAFGCPNREATLQRVRTIAALAPEPAAKKLFYGLSIKVYDESNESWLDLYYDVRMRMEEYHRCKAIMEEVTNMDEDDEEDEDGEADEV